MKIAQILLPGASYYERKSQQIDAAALEKAGHAVVLTDIGDVRPPSADVAHVYGPIEPSLVTRFPLPYVASSPVARRRFAFRQPVLPRFVITPDERDTSRTHVPEAVDESFFQPRPEVPREADVRTVGFYDGGRSGVRSMVERTLHRIERTRDDIRFVVLSGDPRAVDFEQCDAWLDPAVDESDFDGLTAEAVCAQLIVIAARTPLNEQRLEKGRTGFLVPPNDPNETSHAILTALFKPEAAGQRVQSALQTRSKWKPRQRLRALLSLYEACTT